MEPRNRYERVIAFRCQECFRINDTYFCHNCYSEIPADAPKFPAVKVKLDKSDTLLIKQHVDSQTGAISYSYHFPEDITQYQSYIKEVIRYIGKHRYVVPMEDYVISNPESEDTKKEQISHGKPDDSKSEDLMKLLIVRVIDGPQESGNSSKAMDIDSNTDTKEKPDEDTVVEKVAQAQNESSEKLDANAGKSDSEKLDSDSEKSDSNAEMLDSDAKSDSNAEMMDSDSKSDSNLEEPGEVIAEIIEIDDDSTEKIGGQPTEYCLRCRSVVIGSYEVLPPANIAYVAVNLQDSFTFEAPVLSEPDGHVDISLSNDDIVQLRFNFWNYLPIVSVSTTPEFAESVRNVLHMVPSEFPEFPYFDPSSADVKKRNLTFFIETMTEKQKDFIRRLFPGEGKVQEMEAGTADEIFKLYAPHCVSLHAVILITYPSRADGGVVVKYSDYICLDEGRYLNDLMIDFYLKYVLECKADKNITHIFSSYFYKKLTREHKDSCDGEPSKVKRARHKGVQSWTNKVDIFSKRYIIIPINMESHWFLAAICYPNHILNATCEARERPCICIFDSMLSYEKFDRQNVIRILRGYLEMEWKKMGNLSITFDSIIVPGHIIKCPQQKNTIDCGLYLCEYAEQFFMNLVPFRTAVADLNLEHWFPEAIIKGKREAIKSLIKGFHLRELNTP